MEMHGIRLSQQAKDQLLKLKRYTGIKQWNVLCRWALCVSLAEKTDPPDSDIPADSSVEMRWEVFGGEYRDIYMMLLAQRCREAGLSPDTETLDRQFRLHLHRGIGYLAADQDLRTVEALLDRVS